MEENINNEEKKHEDHHEEKKHEDHHEEKKHEDHHEEKKQVDHHEEKKHEDHHKKKKHNTKKNNWKIASFAMGLLLIISLGFNTAGLSSISGDAVAEDAVEFINTQLLQGRATATLEDVSSEKGLVKATINVQGQETPVYVTNDGELMFLQAVPLGDVDAADAPQQAPTQQPTAEVPKSDKPVVELFVMSHCPFGTQIEKGILPVVKELGDSIDFNLKFVYYAMHGEPEVREQVNQHCIQKDQEELFLDYMYCFLGSGSGSEAEAVDCRAEVGVDETALATCVEAANTEFNIDANLEDTSSWLSGRFPLFDVDKADNEKYGVGGSPTLVINGETIPSARDSVSLLTTICSGFNEQPEACSTEFEAGNPTSGFGWGTSGQANAGTAGCGY